MLLQGWNAGLKLGHHRRRALLGDEGDVRRRATTVAVLGSPSVPSTAVVPPAAVTGASQTTPSHGRELLVTAQHTLVDAVTGEPVHLPQREMLVSQMQGRERGERARGGQRAMNGHGRFRILFDTYVLYCLGTACLQAKPA